MLQNEIEFYNDNKQDWIGQGRQGKFVLIKSMDDSMLPSCEWQTFDSMENAYTAGVVMYGNVPMLIREIRKIEPTHTITRLL